MNIETTAMKRSALTVNKKYTEYFLPTVLTAMASNIAMIVDSIIAGNLLGGQALAAINILSPITQLYFALTILFGLGASTIISIEKGKRNADGADAVFTTAFFSVCVLSVLLIACQLPFSNIVCSWLTPDPELRALANSYYIPYIIGTPVTLLLLCSVYCLRTDGRPQFATVIIIVSNVVNLIMDYVLMGIVGTGIAGSAAATVIGNLVGFVMMATHYIKRRNTVHIDFSLLRASKKLTKSFLNLISIGLSGALGTLLITIKMLFLNTLIQKVGGSGGMVSYSICSSSQIFMSMFITGASQTMIPIIGVCLGEKDYDGVRFAFRRAFLILAVSSAVIMILMCIAPVPVINLFGVTEADAVRDAVPALRINALSFPGMAFSFLFLYYYMAVQQKSFSTTISVVNGIVILVPSALILAWLFGIMGVWWSLVVAQTGTLVVIWAIELYKRKRSDGKYNDFYLIESSEKNEVLSVSFKATGENASGVSLYLTSFMTGNGIDSGIANKIAVAAEEMAANINLRTENNKKKKADVDIRICIADGEAVLSIRDNAEPFDPTASEVGSAEFSGLDMLRAISKKIEYSRVLGFNSTVITI